MGVKSCVLNLDLWSMAITGGELRHLTTTRKMIPVFDYRRMETPWHLYQYAAANGKKSTSATA